MSHVSKYAFIHARIHGLMAKSYFDERLRFLLKITSLLDLSRTLFPHQEIESPDGDLVADVQRKFENSIIDTLVGILSFFPKAPELLVHVLREYDYRNLLSLLRGRFTGLTDIRLWDTGKYAVLGRGAAEDFPRSLEKTCFEKYIGWMDTMPLPGLEFQIARQYHAELMSCVKNLPSDERGLLAPLIHTELLHQNLLWALRLKFYFRMGFDEAEKYLFPFGFSGILKQARRVFELPADDPAAWENLAPGNIFSAERGGLIDPEAIEGRATRYFYKKTRHFFYAHPFTLASVYAFFRIKKYEARLVTSVSEGIRMGISSRELAEILGVP
ncbi:MAG: V-type ATPase subunit [Spirochaetales bacterium]|jgi:vacuolar-type H+-ATPase subunit C/Vma6|nr:V-type ATPase subunit [Spirochaetales bacterium]